jgi:hypothetical protein
MVSRRRFIEMTVATSVAGAAVGVSQDAFAAATSGSTWSSTTWRGLQGKRVTLLDASGVTHAAKVGVLTVQPAQSGMTGEAFTVALHAVSGSIEDGLYRLRGGISGQIALVEGDPGTAVLTVNTMKPGTR